MPASPSITTLPVGQMATNCYIVCDDKSRQGIIIDPGDDAEYISDTLIREKIIPTMIVATHGHFDHVMAAFALQTHFRIPFCIHAEDVFLVRRMAETAKHFLNINVIDPSPRIDMHVEDGGRLSIGASRLIIHHTPGHTPGSICLEIPGVLFVGDTIFAGGAVGRTDHVYASKPELDRSIARILKYPNGTELLPGHGEKTSVGSELGFHVQ